MYGFDLSHFKKKITMLREKFLDRLISLHGDQSNPFRSCDLTPYDFSLWGYTKSRVYQNKVRNVLEFKREICRVLNELNRAMYDRMMINFMERIIACRANRKGHMPDIVFHC
jgi:hypothetical protein